MVRPSAALHTRAHRIISVIQEQRISRRVHDRILGDFAARRGDAIGRDAIGVAPNNIGGFATSARSKSRIELPAQRTAVPGRVPSAIKCKVAPIVDIRALAPPEKPIGVIHNSQLLGQFDLAEKIIHAGAGQKNRVGEINRERRRAVVINRHRRGHVVEIRPGFGSEREQPLHHIDRPRRNIRHVHFVARGRP